MQHHSGHFYSHPSQWNPFNTDTTASYKSVRLLCGVDISDFPFIQIVQCLTPRLLRSNTVGKLSSNMSFNPETSFIFSAECTIGMVWALTPLKHYGNKALWP